MKVRLAITLLVGQMLLALCVSSLVISDPSHCPFGKRVDARKLSAQEFSKHYDGTCPVVLTHVFDREQEKQFSCDDATATLIRELGDKTIEYDVRQSCGIDTYEAGLGEFLSSVPDNSDHDDSMYMMSEDILRSNKKLANLFNLPTDLFGSDYFSFFPEKIRPRQALIIGGMGSRSFLHSDPFDWVGTNFLLEGKKIWLFFPPTTPMELFEAEFNAPDAWGPHQVAAGRVSYTVDLFNKLGHKSSLEKYWDTVASTLSSAEAEEIKSKSTPRFGSGISSLDNADAKSPLFVQPMKIVQKEGEMILIPPGWWHQVYHVQPSIAVAGQYCNKKGSERVFSHMLSCCATGRKKNNYNEEIKLKEFKDLLPSDFDSLTPPSQVSAVLRACLTSKHGKMGNSLFEELEASES